MRFQRVILPLALAAALWGLLALTYGAAASPLSEPGVPRYAWSATVVDNSADVGWFSSLALDKAGRPHVSYQDSTNFSLKYARLTSTGWVSQTVERLPDGVSGLHTSLHLDALDRPRISYDYSDVAFLHLKYARYDGLWHTEMVDSGADAGAYSSLDLDSAGNPHVSYQQQTAGGGGVLKYAYWNGSAWTIEQVAEDGNFGGYTSLVLDGAGNPHISYYDAAAGAFKYASRAAPGGPWSITTVETIGAPSGGATSLAIEPTTPYTPHIAYQNSMLGWLNYAVWDGTRWITSTIDTGSSVGTFLALDLDIHGQPGIAYSDVVVSQARNNYRLKYAWWHNGWNTAAVDEAGDVGRSLSLVIDEHDQPHITYYDPGNDQLKYAVGTSAFFQLYLPECSK